MTQQSKKGEQTMHREGKKWTIVVSVIALLVILFFHNWLEKMIGLAGTILLSSYPVGFILYLTYDIILQNIKSEREARTH